MIDLLQGTAPHPNPPREEPLERAGEISTRPGAGTREIATRTRRHAPHRVRAALSGRRRQGGLPEPRSRASAGSGVSPIAGGTSRGVAILVGR